MRVIDSKIDIFKSLKKLIETADEICRGESYNCEKVVSLKRAIQSHAVECMVAGNEVAANPDDLKDINI